jgi:hypothetical protein
MSKTKQIFYLGNTPVFKNRLPKNAELIGTNEAFEKFYVKGQKTIKKIKEHFYTNDKPF